LAEKSAEGKLHEVSDVEADAVIEYASRAIPHNEMLGRVVRNMYRRIQALEAELAFCHKELDNAQIQKVKAPKRGGP
jgi:hypothetical protein